MLEQKYSGDNLIAGNTHPLSAQTVTIKSGEGKLKRGSVLMRDANGKYVLADTSAGTAEVILAADVDATSADTVAEVYCSGDFNETALIVADGYTLTDADRLALKGVGIYVVIAVPIMMLAGSLLMGSQP